MHAEGRERRRATLLDSAELTVFRCPDLLMYRGEHIPWVKGSVCYALEFPLPPFSPPLPSVEEVSKQNMH